MASRPKRTRFARLYGSFGLPWGYAEPKFARVSGEWEGSVTGTYQVCHPKVACPTADGESQLFVRGLIDGMRCGILAVDRDRRLVMINELGRQILDLPDTPRSGTPIDEALGDHPQLVQLLCESFGMKSLPNRAELELHRGEAKSKTIGFTLSMIPGEEDEPVGAAVFFKDLTLIEHKEVQDRLRDRLAALGQMAASMAHEIRNPLAAIDVSCSLLKRKMPEQGQERELLEKIAGEVRRLNRTIDSSLEFVRPVALSPSRGSLDTVIGEAVSLAAERCSKPGVRIQTESLESVPEFLMDPEQLRRAFENLVVNAVEAMESEGRVTISARLVPAPRASSVPYRPTERGDSDPWSSFEHFVVVRVADDGPGIPESERDRIFYPFFTTKKQGSGVGLSTVKKIVDSHRGLIDVERSEAGGALFTVRLPLVTGAGIP